MVKRGGMEQILENFKNIFFSKSKIYISRRSLNILRLSMEGFNEWLPRKSLLT